MALAAGGHLESRGTDGFSPRSCQDSLEKAFKQGKVKEDKDGNLGKSFEKPLNTES